jgi:hypothetical protein
MKQNKPVQDNGDSKYRPSPNEQAALGKYLRRRATESAARIKVLNGGTNVTITPDHPNKTIGQVLLAEALGTADDDFLKGLVNQLANANLRDGKIDEDALNFMLSIVKGIKPRDQVETMLAAQMAAIHQAMLTFARRLAHVETINQQDSAERALNKLALTFAIQMEALKRYRTGGEQKVTVQHVSVSEGGQAIVGNVTQAAHGAGPERSANLAPALSHSKEPPMPIIGETACVPVASERGRKAPSPHRRKKDDGRSPS